MHDASKLILALTFTAALGACHKQNAEQNNSATAITDISNADAGDIEALPPDESSATPSNELVNGDDEAAVNDANTAANNGD